MTTIIATGNKTKSASIILCVCYVINYSINIRIKNDIKKSEVDLILKEFFIIFSVFYYCTCDTNKTG